MLPKDFSRGPFTDRRFFYSTAYSTSYNIDIPLSKKSTEKVCFRSGFGPKIPYDNPERKLQGTGFSKNYTKNVLPIMEPEELPTPQNKYVDDYLSPDSHRTLEEKSAKPQIINVVKDSRYTEPLTSSYPKYPRVWRNKKNIHAGNNLNVPYESPADEIYMQNGCRFPRKLAKIGKPQHSGFTHDHESRDEWKESVGDKWTYESPKNPVGSHYEKTESIVDAVKVKNINAIPSNGYQKDKFFSPIYVENKVKNVKGHRNISEVSPRRLAQLKKKYPMDHLNVSEKIGIDSVSKIAFPPVETLPLIYSKDTDNLIGAKEQSGSVSNYPTSFWYTSRMYPAVSEHQSKFGSALNTPVVFPKSVIVQSGYNRI